MDEFNMQIQSEVEKNLELQEQIKYHESIKEEH